MAVPSARTMGCSGCLIEAIVRQDEQRLRNLLSDACQRGFRRHLLGASRQHLQIHGNLSDFVPGLANALETNVGSFRAALHTPATGARGVAGGRATC